MNDLDEMVESLRAEYSEGGDAAGTTRARLLKSAARQEQQRRWQLAGLIVLALVVTNATTWAWASGELTRWASPAISDSRATALSATEHTTVEPERSPTDRRPEPAGAARALPAQQIAQAASDAPLAPHRAEPPPARARTAASPPPTEEDSGELSRALLELEPLAPLGAEPIDAADRRAFEAAHQLHFGGAPADEARRAWDSYLARFPNGSFVPEARFNRAIALLRLGQRDEARAALVPFARGQVESLHRDEARALVDAIDDGRIRGAEPP